METLGNLNLEKLKDQDLEIVGMIEIDNRLGVRHLLENKPVVVVQSKHIDIKLPDGFSIEWLAKKCFDQDQIVKVRNENNNTLEDMKFSDLVAMFKKDNPSTVFSFEFDLNEKKKICNEFDVPKVIRDICSFDKLVRFTKKISINSRNVFTDFKISSSHLTEWYHVVNGLIVLYLVEPSSHNVNVVNDWIDDKNRRKIYLPDRFNTKCYSYILKKSNTLFLPRNWIYAIFVYDNALVFHGEMITLSTSGIELSNKKRKLDKTD